MRNLSLPRDLMRFLLVMGIALFFYANAFADAGSTQPSVLSKALVPFLHYFNIIAPWLVIAGIPSIINGLTSYPKADGIVKALKVILNILSVLTHKDSPGTFKAPFVMSKPPTGTLTQPETR